MNKGHSGRPAPVAGRGGRRWLAGTLALCTLWIWLAAGPVLAQGEMTLNLKDARITSYNVCYTKLLRCLAL